MLKKLFIIGSATGILFISCVGTSEHPGQVGNRQKLDIYHQQKKVK